MRHPTRAETEVRGPDDYDVVDWGPRPSNKGTRSMTDAELKALPIKGPHPDSPPRCWCGRPQLASTGQCREGHLWSGAT